MTGPELSPVRGRVGASAVSGAVQCHYALRLCSTFVFGLTVFKVHTYWFDILVLV